MMDARDAARQADNLATELSGGDELRAEQALIAADAWSLLARRQLGAPLVRFETTPAMAAHPRSSSILEIVNDDMPFLLDSVLDELAERGIAIRFVVHPIFSVERDAAGRLVA